VRSLAMQARALGLGELARACEYEAFFANRYRLFVGGDHAEAWLALFGDTLLASPARRRAVALELATLVDDARGLLVATDRIGLYDRPLAAVLAARLQRESPGWSERALASLPADVRAELERRLADVHDPVRAVRIGLGVGGTIVTTMLAFVVHVPGMFYVGGAAAFLAPSARKMYQRRVRRELSDIFATLGVQADTAIAWARSAGERGKDLMRFEVELTTDASLALLGAIAAFVREHQRAPVDGPAAIYR
jgi:hypothetical protein